jgi:glycosyltransferase involved in cell wall biosynthesis
LAKTAVLIPAYNESDSIVSVINEINDLKLGLKIVVINDGSSDATRQMAISSGVVCLSHPINCGVGAALITGLTWSIECGYDQIVIVDADGQHPVNSIGSMLNVLEESDIVVGCRDWHQFDAIWFRRYAHNILRIALRLKYDIRITDVTSGFRAMNIKAAMALVPSLGDQYLEDTIMLLVEAKKHKLKIAQVPVTIRNRQAGEPSHSVWKSAIRYMSVLMKVLLASKGRLSK